MKSKILLFISVVIISSLVCVSILFNTGAYKTWTSYEVLTAAELNAQFLLAQLKTAFDDSVANYGLAAPATFSDSLLVKMFKAAFPDSFNAGVARDVLLQRRAAFDDSVNNYGLAAPATFSDSLLVKMFRAAFPDSFTAGWARTNVDSSKVTDGSISNADIRTDLTTKWTAAHTRVTADSANWNFGYVKGTAAHTRVAADSANWNTGFIQRLIWNGGSTGLTASTGRTSLGLGSLATLSAVDSTLVSAGALSVTDISNGANGFALKTDDALKLLLAAFDDSLFSRKGKEWLVSLPDFCDTTASALDSTTVKSLFNIDGLYGRKKLLYVYGNASTAADSTIWGATFNPQDDNPDSLIVWAYTTDQTNTSFSIEIYNSAGTRVYSSGNITLAAATTWTYKGVTFGSFADLNEHAIVYRVRVLNSGDAIQIGQVRFKRN